MRKFLFLMLMFGILMLYISRMQLAPPARVEYRYIPRTMDSFYEDAALNVSDLFKTMHDPDTGNVWLQAYTDQKLQSTVG